MTKEKHAAELRTGNISELADWASKAPQPFTLSEELMQALKDKGVGDYVDRLPDSNFFAVSGDIGGTAHCISGGYFNVENGRARTADGPKNWDEDACFGGTRWFGTVDGTPVAFQDDYRSDGPELTSNLSVAPWVKDHFAPFCTVEFKFAPRFSSHGTANHWEESCSIGSCEALRKVAMNLVQEVQKNPAATEKLYVERLTPSQRNSFHLLTTLAEADTAEHGACNSWGRFGEMLPVVVNGNFYLASLGHIMSPWFEFSDWGVTFDRLDGDKKVTAACFAIGMAKGSLIDVRVK